MIGLITFNNSAYGYNETLTKATSSNIEKMLSYIDRITASGTVHVNIIQ